MSERDDGGPAFPTEATPDIKKQGEDPDHPGSGRIGLLTVKGRPASHGMTLRDYFAAQALGVLELAVFGDKSASLKGEIVAEYAYRIADAMLKERAK